jgi:hypothetical protein
MIARMFLFQWIMEWVGFQRFVAWSESWGTAKFVVFGGHMSIPFLTFAIDYALLCILMIPLYMLWSFTRTERRDKYLAAIGGKTFDDDKQV